MEMQKGSVAVRYKAVHQEVKQCYI